MWHILFLLLDFIYHCGSIQEAENRLSSVWTKETICYQGDELDKNGWSAGDSTNTEQKDSDEKDKLGSEEDNKGEDNQEQDVMDKVEVEQDDKEEFEEDSDFNSTEL